MWKEIQRAPRHGKAWFLLIAFVIGLFVMLFLEVTGAPDTGHAVNTHGCAPATPSPFPGSPTPTPTSPAPATPGVIVINEVLTTPASAWNCADPPGTFSFNREAWIELYNPQSQAFNVSSAILELISSNMSHYAVMPPGTMIAAHGFLVLFPSTWTVFQLTEGELQFVISGVIIDQVNIPALTPDQSYARIPDGGSNWQLANTPTIDASNTSSTLASPTSSGPPPTHVATKRSRRRLRGTNSSSSGSGSTNGTDGATLRNDGTQPGWSNLQLPAAASSTVAAPEPGPGLGSGPPSPQRSSGNGGVDPQHIILITLLGASLAGVAFWGCWHFKGRKLS